jgi:hypothetical protein
MALRSLRFWCCTSLTWPLPDGASLAALLSAWERNKRALFVSLSQALAERRWERVGVRGLAE